MQVAPRCGAACSPNAPFSDENGAFYLHKSSFAKGSALHQVVIAGFF